MNVFRTALNDPLTWGALGVTAAVSATIAMRFPLASGELSILGAFAVVQFASWLILAGASGRYRRRWNESQLNRARDQLERNQRRVDSLDLAFTRLEFETGTERLESLSDSYASFRQAVGTHHTISQPMQRRLSELAGNCYDRGLSELESLSGLVRTLQGSGGGVNDHPDANRLIANTQRLSEELIAVSLSFSDGSGDSEARAEAKLMRLAEGQATPPPVPEKQASGQNE
ncbi:MAG: hypothetical protein AAGD13_22190 [Pseudomonadota bacterium]